MLRRLAEFGRTRRAFWSSVPRRGLAEILAGAFFLFSAIGFLTDVLTIGRYPLPIVFAIAALSGATAVCLVLTSIRSLKFLPAALAFYLVLAWVNGLATGSRPIDAATYAAFIVHLRVDVGDCRFPRLRVLYRIHRQRRQALSEGSHRGRPRPGDSPAPGPLRCG
jgi:hypothetical protein